MRPRRPRRASIPILERVESRNLPGPFGLPFSLPALIGRIGPVKDVDTAGMRRLLAALRGGAGQEFRQLLTRQVRNPGRIIAQFATGQRTTFETRGFAARTPKLLESFAGPKLDQWNPIASGAIVLKNGQLSLAAIMRGPIDRPETVRYVWALDTGRGATPQFPALGTVQADTLVTVERTGGIVKLSVSDLVSGETRELNSGIVKIAGPTVRLRLIPAQHLPQGGLPIAQASFAFWTQNAGSDDTSVGRMLPDHNLPVGVLR